MSFADNFKLLMKERGVTLRVISKVTGVPTSTLSEWTAGRDPKLGEPIMKVARFFGVSLEFLVTGHDPNEEAVKGIISNIEENFTTIHQGVYRVRVEKLQNTKKTQKE